MSDPTPVNRPNRPRAGPEGETPIAELIRLAGHRPQPAAFRTMRARTAVEAEWRRTVRRRARRSFWRLAAVAAVVLAATLGGRLVFRQASPTPAAAPVIATLLRAAGSVEVAPGHATPRPIHPGETITAGAAINTAKDGRAALRLADGTSLRLDVDSRIVLETASRLSLERGTVYVDSGYIDSQSVESRSVESRSVDRGAADPRPVDPGSSSASAGTRSVRAGVEVVTTHGTVRDIGTQFEVRAMGSALEIRVREGEVRVDRPRGDAQRIDSPRIDSQGIDSPPIDSLGGALAVRRAESVRIAADWTVERRTAPVDGPAWAWVEAIAPPFTLEGATLESFLQWVTREQAWTWRFKDDAAARHGAGVVLHGSIEGLTPAEALDAVLPTCGMAYQRNRTQLVVAVASR